MRIGQTLPLTRLRGLVELLNSAYDEPDVYRPFSIKDVTRAVEFIETYLEGDVDLDEHFTDTEIESLYDELLDIFGVNIYGMSKVFKFYVNYNFKVFIILRY